LKKTFTSPNFHFRFILVLMLGRERERKEERKTGEGKEERTFFKCFFLSLYVGFFLLFSGETDSDVSI